MIKRMVVELDRDPTLYADGNIVEVSSHPLVFCHFLDAFQWPRAPGHHNPAMDGFTIRRTGDVPTKMRIILYLDHFPEQFKVHPELGSVLGIKEESRIGAVQTLWNYIKLHNLQDKTDRRKILADDRLRPIFGADSVLFPKLPDIVNRCLLPPDPVILNYTLNPLVAPPERPLAYDVELKTEDTSMKSRMAVTVAASKESAQTLLKIDEEVRICASIPLLSVFCVVVHSHPPLSTRS